MLENNEICVKSLTEKDYIEPANQPFGSELSENHTNKENQMSDVEFAKFMIDSIMNESKENYINGKDELLKSIKKYNLDVNNFEFKVMDFYFDRGFADGYRHYDGYFAIPKKISNKVSYAKLGFDCSTLSFYNNNDEVIFTSTTECYDDFATPKAFVIHEDDLSDEPTVKEIQEARILSLKEKYNLN